MECSRSFHDCCAAFATSPNAVPSGASAARLVSAPAGSTYDSATRAPTTWSLVVSKLTQPPAPGPLTSLAPSFSVAPSQGPCAENGRSKGAVEWNRTPPAPGAGTRPGHGG